MHTFLLRLNTSEKRISSIIFFFLITLICHAQSVTPSVLSSAGQYSFSSSGSIQWNLGETMTETYANGSNFITQGFEQPEVFITTSMNTPLPVSLTAYPNPAKDFINLKFPAGISGDYSGEIFDVAGQKVYAEQFHAEGGSVFNIKVNHIANGVYFLVVKRNGSLETSTFRICKTI